VTRNVAAAAASVIERPSQYMVHRDISTALRGSSSVGILSGKRHRRWRCSRLVTRNVAPNKNNRCKKTNNGVKTRRVDDTTEVCDRQQYSEANSQTAHSAGAQWVSLEDRLTAVAAAVVDEARLPAVQCCAVSGSPSVGHFPCTYPPERLWGPSPLSVKIWGSYL